ncbi:Lj965 prophage major tail protein [Streptococcus pneumoniae]|nr:Lj965 prophage major tail protein [Streptococcus pneumoniae]
MSTVIFEGQVSVKLGGGGVNAVIDFTLKIALQSNLTFTAARLRELTTT